MGDQSPDSDRRHELRADLIAALMSADNLAYADAERVVGDFERICRVCGSKIEDEAAVELVIPPNKITRQQGKWDATIVRPVPLLDHDSLSGTIWAGNSR